MFKCAIKMPWNILLLDIVPKDPFEVLKLKYLNYSNTKLVYYIHNVNRKQKDFFFLI